MRQVLDAPGGANYSAKNKLVSPNPKIPNLPRKQQHKNSFNQFSGQKKQPPSEANKKQYNAQLRHLPYGHNYIESDDDARSDFKTTTLRFTNNNFIVEDPRKRTNGGGENTTGGF